MALLPVRTVVVFDNDFWGVLTEIDTPERDAKPIGVGPRSIER